MAIISIKKTTFISERINKMSQRNVKRNTAGYTVTLHSLTKPPKTNAKQQLEVNPWETKGLFPIKLNIRLPWTTKSVG